MRVFVIGAGASIDHSGGKLPGAETFIARAVEVIGSVQKLAAQKTALQLAIQRFYGLDPFDGDRKQELKAINIEDLLTLCSLEKEIDPQFPSVAIFADVIVKTILSCQAEIAADRSTYRRFIEGCLQSTDSIITFNWDTLLDPLIPGYMPHTKTVGDGMYRNYQRICTAEWERTVVGMDFQDSYTTIGEFVVRHGSGGEDRAFIKLHGSVDLIHCLNAGCRQHARPFRSPNLGEPRFCGVCHEPLWPYIIPPIQAKPIRQAPYIRRAWSVASRLLQRADEVVFWGYSLPPTDYWANWLIRHAWFGACTRIVVINPSVYYAKQPGFRTEFVRRFAPVRFARGRQEVAVCRTFEDYEDGRTETVSPLREQDE